MEVMVVEGVEVEIVTSGHHQAEINMVARLQDVTGIGDMVGHLLSTIGTIASVTEVAVQRTGTAGGVIEKF
jgi:hypothetical protein